MKKTLTRIVGSALFAGLVMVQTATLFADTAKPAATPAKTSSQSKKTTAPPPSDSDIAAAKAKGLVWLNLNTKVYHGSGDKEYGKTKNGKFVTEADAKAAGAKQAKN